MPKVSQRELLQDLEPNELTLLPNRMFWIRPLEGAVGRGLYRRDVHDRRRTKKKADQKYPPIAFEEWFTFRPEDLRQ